MSISLGWNVYARYSIVLEQRLETADGGAGQDTLPTPGARNLPIGDLKFHLWITLFGT